MTETDSKTLFTAKGTSAVPDVPAIVGMRCKSCGAVAFPFQPFGCENCGSPNVAREPFDGQGRVITTARVHVHADPNLPAPFTVAAVLLDCGAFVRGIVAEESAESLEIGDGVVTKLVPQLRPDRGEWDIRFARKRDS